MKKTIAAFLLLTATPLFAIPQPTHRLIRALLTNAELSIILDDIEANTPPNAPWGSAFDRLEIEQTSLTPDMRARCKGGYSRSASAVHVTVHVPDGLRGYTFVTPGGVESLTLCE